MALSDKEATLPRPPLTEFEVGRIALCGMEGRITQDNPPSVTRAHQPLQRGIRAVGGGTLPRHDPPLA